MESRLIRYARELVYRVHVALTREICEVHGHAPSIVMYATHMCRWMRYLGVQKDRSMRMAAQVEHVIHQSRAARSMLRPVLQSHLPLRAKVALYKGYIRSRFTYAVPAWAPLNSFGTSHQRKRGRRAADPYPSNYSEHLLPKIEPDSLRGLDVHEMEPPERGPSPPDPSGPYSRREDARA
ncbi:hypothetical protein EVAR_96980_1 [Eumeta japonica]|uniref:Uncharacterized protein n=1 Tax=Eumeta variegata TaxID=151549 RepID=A0A4C1VDU5_EUMVA|nr:hypothetical protein EVAR_96980_1 [Eumeta japonica]